MAEQGKAFKLETGLKTEDREILDVYGQLGVTQFGLKQSKVETKWDSQEVLRFWMHGGLRNLDFIPQVVEKSVSTNAAIGEFGVFQRIPIAL